MPKSPTLFSNKINYQWNQPSTGEKEIFVLDKLNGKLIKTNKSILNENNQLSTLRFYTSQPTDFVALGFASLYTQLIQESNLDNIDELMDEVTEINSEDDVYAEEEVK